MVGGGLEWLDTDRARCCRGLGVNAVAIWIYLRGLLLAGLPPSGIRPIRRDKKGDVVRWKGAIGDDDAWCKSGLPGQIRGRYQRD